MPRVVGLFQRQFLAERCLSELELRGFTPAEVAVILFSANPAREKPNGLLDWMSRGGLFGDTVDQSDGASVMDGMTVAASIAGLVGMIWGSRLNWGPVIWGFIGILGGGLTGLIVDKIVPIRRRGLYHLRRVKGVVQVEVTSEDPARLAMARDILERNEPDQTAFVGGE